MSLSASRWAWDQGQLSPSAKFVLLALADHCDKGATESGPFVCYPSLRRIAARTGLALSTVKTTLNELERACLIERQRGRRGKATTYRLPGAGLAVGREPAIGRPGAGPGRPGAGLAVGREPAPNQSIEPVMNQSLNQRARAHARDSEHEPAWMKDEDPTAKNQEGKA